MLISSETRVIKQPALPDTCVRVREINERARANKYIPRGKKRREDSAGIMRVFAPRNKAKARLDEVAR